MSKRTLGLVVALTLLGACDGAAPPERRPTTASPSSSPSGSALFEPGDLRVRSLGFHPPSRREAGRVVVPVTFLDGSSAEIVADPSLGVQDMSVQVFTSGGLGGTDRTLNFRYGSPAGFVFDGPFDTYEGHDGSLVELWEPDPDFPAGCRYLLYRFGRWYVAVRTCQDDLSTLERERWARLLRGSVTKEGWLVLSARKPLELTPAGGHEGPEAIFGMDRSNWIEIEPGRCAGDGLGSRDLREMSDGTVVAFSRTGGRNKGRDDDWFVAWCEDGYAYVQVSNAYEGFAKAAAEGFRLRDIVLTR